MKSFLKKIFNSLKLKFALTSNDRFSSYLRKKGFSIGNNCQFFARQSLYFDMTRPYLVTIGNNVVFTKGVTILTHGYDWSVLKHVYKTVIGSARGVSIGNNVFIGVNSVILPGSKICNNVIIGSGSIVAGIIEENSVYAGNPARKIMTLDEYFLKRKINVLNEIVELSKNYISRYGKFPPEEIFYEHFELFVPRINFESSLLKNYVLSKSFPYFEEFLSSTPFFRDYNEMKMYILSKIS